MATATLSTSPHTHVRSATSAAVLSVLGTIAAIGIAAIGLLVVPVALLIAFGPSLLAMF